MESLVPYAVSCLQVGAGFVLVLSGSLKLAAPDAIRVVVGSLGFRRTSLLSTGLSVWEILAGLDLAIAPNWLSSLLVGSLAISFAVAAAIALTKRLRVNCACFGTALSMRLGWRQLVLLPIWILVAVSALGQPWRFDPQRITWTFGLVGLIAISGMLVLIPLQIEHRAQRRAIAEA